jgi:Na+-translocating ferredoxin:NAD+ oxidoreductase RnfG subunit
MKKPKKQYGQLFTIAVVLYLLALAAYGFWNYTYQKSKLLDNIDTKLYHCAIALKHILPDDLHDRAIDEQAISIEEDIYIVRKIVKLTEETGIKYIYTVIKKKRNCFLLHPHF